MVVPGNCPLKSVLIPLEQTVAYERGFHWANQTSFVHFGRNLLFDNLNLKGKSLLLSRVMLVTFGYLWGHVGSKVSAFWDTGWNFNTKNVCPCPVPMKPAS